MNRLANLNSQHLSSRWLLGDFHIYTQWSDGSESMETVVDLYGDSGFDAICVTAHGAGYKACARSCQPQRTMMTVQWA